MCDYCKEDKPILGCSFTIVDSEGDVTTLEKHEQQYYDHELSQYAQYFKALLKAVGYEWIDEVKVISHKHDDIEEKEFSSEDF